jgi:type I restriction enzyme S subunit
LEGNEVMVEAQAMNPPRSGASWKTVRAGEVGGFGSGSGFPLRYQGRADGDYPFFKVSDMNRDGNEVLLMKSANYITDDTRRVLGAVVFPPKSIVFAKVGAAVFLDRKRILVQPSCLDNNMAAFVPSDENVDPSFIYFAFLAIRLSAFASTTALPALSGGALSGISLLLPPLPEQRAIAAVLSDVDELIGSLEAVIAKKRAVKQATMQELLTGRTRLPGFEGEWEATTFDRVLNHHSGAAAFIKGDLQARPGAGYYPGFSASGQDVWLRSYAHTGEALVVSAVGSRCGRAFRATGRWTAIANTHVVWPVERFVSCGFLRLYLDDEEFWLKGGSGQPFVQFRDSFARAVLLPTVTEQRAIAGVVGDMDAEIFALEQRLDKSRAIKQGVMQQLLSGAIRLPITDHDGEDEEAHVS